LSRLFADWLSQAYSFSVENNVWARPDDNRVWGYSDGDEVEQRIAKAVASAFDRSLYSREIRDAITDWPSHYHLSARRSHLLRPLRDRLQGSILEIGAGCGAISRYLGEINLDVVAVEGSPRRAAIAASRCIELSNVAVVADDFHHLPLGTTFDVVTLIGVVEYARLFSQNPSRDAVDAILARALQFLKPDGLLIIAIENQLGLKYFAGSREDHVGRAMFGVEDRYAKDGVVTFGRRELAGRLRQV
jgi:SAM-dependent methyltransferase